MTSLPRLQITLLTIFAGLLSALTGSAEPSEPTAIFHQPGDIVVPKSSLQKLGDVGVKAHTNHLLFIPAGLEVRDQAVHRRGGGDTSNEAYIAETPAALREVYGLPPNGGAGIIAIIDIHHYPTALNDFNVFAQHFGLPVERSGNVMNASNRVFQVIYADGEQPSVDASWAEETAIDIQSAHAMAPRAKILLIEAASESWQDILAAVSVANSTPFVKEVSMSFGSSEFPQELAFDAFFTKPGVTYVAASGDVGGQIIWPGCSRNVISVGGTSIVRDATTGEFLRETGWADTSGGLSYFEKAVYYQLNIPEVAAKVGNRRGVPDIAFDADPNSGVYVYDSTPYFGQKGWFIAGGTSVAAPCIAGVINSVAVPRGYFLKTANELTLIYNNLGTANFRDVTEGAAGGNVCTPGYDFVTGVGTPLGLFGK